MARDPVAHVLAAYPVVHHALRRRVEPGTGKVSDHQTAVLAHLDRADPKSLTELAADMRVSLPTMSLTVDRLVAGGLVRRDRDPADRRRVLLRLAAAGVRLRSGHSLVDPERVRALLAVLTPAERALGVDGLTTLARAARRLALGEPPTARPKEEQ